MPAIENKQPGSLMGRRKGRHRSPKSDLCAEKPEKLQEYRYTNMGQGDLHARETHMRQAGDGHSPGTLGKGQEGKKGREGSEA